MVKNKQKKKYPGASAPHTRVSGKEKKHTAKWFPACMPYMPYAPYALFFLLTWLFCGMVYGDVFYMAQQNSYFAFDSTIMQNVVDLQNGWLVLSGRFMLLAYHYPVLGGLLLAVLLTLSALIISRLLSKLPCLTVASPWMTLSFVPAVAYLAVVVGRGLNLYFQYDPWYLLVSPLMFVLLLLLFLPLANAWKKSNQVALFGESPSTLKGGLNGGMFSFPGVKLGMGVVVCVALLYAFAIFGMENTRATAKMERLMEEEDWDGMIAAARRCSRPSRSVACYHAIALVQTDRVMTDLFHIRYQFPDLHLKDREGKEDNGVNYYTPDGDYAAGLLNTSYHECMESVVLDGPTVKKFKRMFLCALLNGENALAEKYMHLISKVPFEGAFVEKYAPMLKDKELVMRDANLARVSELRPVEDHFEQSFRTPYFIGYNVALKSGRSRRALLNSAAACLYGKLLDGFCTRVTGMAGIPMSSNGKEALMLVAMKYPAIGKTYKVDPITYQRFQTFMGDVARMQDEDKMKMADELWKTSRSYYPYYYYYGNIYESEKATKSANEKGGVN